MFALLRLLGDGAFHSGEGMAKQLGVSRASVNNALREAEDFGLTLYRVRGRGYCLAEPPQWLDHGGVVRCLGTRGSEFDLVILDSAHSTNTLLMREMTEGAASGRVLAVEWQSAGRGRMGRKWYSALGSGLTFSLLWRFDCGLGALSGLSLAVGVALIRALRGLGIESAQLKWPNDVLDERGAKLAGVLIEAQGEMLGPSAVVIGIGLNLSLPRYVSQLIGRPAAGLTEMHDKVPDRNQLLAALLLALGDILREFGEYGFAALCQEWERHHAFQDRPVRISLPDSSQLVGIARGVTDEGALTLETDGTMQILHAGDISLTAEMKHAVA